MINTQNYLTILHITLYNCCLHVEECNLTSFARKSGGKVDGAEAVQVYTSQPKASVARPAKELKAFSKVYLKAGETKIVELEIKAKDMAFFDENLKDWKLEKGEFVLSNAASSAQVKSNVKIRID